jgi:plasmid stabilization system protein ParE
VTRRLIVRPFAEQAIAEAFDYYHAIRPELGRRFIAAVDRAIAAVGERPEAWPLVTATKRRYPLHLEDAFPYVVYYSVTDAEIVIVTIIHGKRHPSRWKRAR